MQTIECIRGRRSVRRYKEEKISKGDIIEILDAAAQAPSSGNVQDWEFIVVQKPETKLQLQETAMFGQKFISTASAIIVVCSNLDRMIIRYGERGKSLYSIQNTAAAAQNLMLAAWDKGFGTCWVGAFNEQKVKDILILPTNVRPVAMITLGYPGETPDKKTVVELNKVVHWER
ncbi:MAG: nitroreductase family protein [Nanoarchaeota archaeon]